MSIFTYQVPPAYLSLQEKFGHNPISEGNNSENVSETTPQERVETPPTIPPPQLSPLRPPTPPPRTFVAAERYPSYSSSSSDDDFVFDLPDHTIRAPIYSPPTIGKKAPPRKRANAFNTPRPKKRKIIQKPPLSESEEEEVDLEEEEQEEDVDSDSSLGSLRDFINDDPESEVLVEKEPSPVVPQKETSSEVPKVPIPKAPESANKAPDLDSEKPATVEDMILMGCLKIISFGEKVPMLQGITKRTYDDKFWRYCMANCVNKWKKEKLSKLSPEHMLLFATGMVVVDVAYLNYNKNETVNAAPPSPAAENVPSAEEH